MRSINHLVSAFDRILQRDITISCNKKIIRKGSFILYTIKDYVISIIIKTPTSNKSYDIYYPFNVEVHDDMIELDYTLASIQREKRTNTIELDSSTCNKFLDKKLYIKF